MTSIRTAPLIVAIAAAFALAACGKKEEAPKPVVTPAPAPAPAPVTPPPVAPAPVALADIVLGNTMDPTTKAVSSTSTSGTFARTDTIYAAVNTTGAASSAVIVARWTFGEGQLVDESSQTIAPTGPATTTFHIAKPDGWPVGKYKIDVTLDGKPAGSKDFEVQ